MTYSSWPRPRCSHPRPGSNAPIYVCQSHTVLGQGLDARIRDLRVAQTDLGQRVTILGQGRDALIRDVQAITHIYFSH